ncbi:MAG: hypothetical protein AMXMBFR64_21600 [Myxococcales bacterium]
MRRVFFALALALATPAVADVPATVTFQGLLTTSAGLPADGTFNLSLKLFPAATGGAAVYSQNLGSVTVTAGMVDTTMGPLTTALLAAPELWVELTVIGEPPLPRQRLRSVPYALQSEAATSAGSAAALLCSGCVGAGHLAPNLLLGGNVGSTGTLTTCTDGATGCGLKVGGAAALVDPKDGMINLQVTGGLRLRTVDNGAWAPLQAGAVTAQGPLVAAAGSTLTAPVVVTGNGQTVAGTGTVRVERDAGEVNVLAVGAGTGGAIIALEPGSGGKRWGAVSHGAGDAGAEAGAFAVRDEATGKRPLVVRPDGRVGVGTGAAESALHVVSDANNAVTGTDATLRVDNHRDAHTPLAVHQNKTDTYAARLVTDGWGLRVTQAAGAAKSAAVSLLSVDTDGGTTGNVLRVQANGNVGMGTTSPAARLHVAGNIRADGTVHASTGVIVAGQTVVDATGKVIGPVDPSTHAHAVNGNADNAKLIASSMCAVMGGGGHTTACPRICSNTSADCNQICAGGGGSAFNALHIYVGYLERVYVYNGTSGSFCGPNWCCCRLEYNACPTPW